MKTRTKDLLERHEQAECRRILQVEWAKLSNGIAAVAKVPADGNAYTLDVPDMELSSNPLDIHSEFNAEDGRLDTTFPVLPHDEEEGKRIADALNLPEYVGCMGTAVATDKGRSVVVNQDDEGLPPLGDNWEWSRAPEGIGGSVTERYPGGATCQHYFATAGAAQAGRHLLSRHDRERGCYWADHFRALAAELLADADEHTNEAVAQRDEDGHFSRFCAGVETGTRDAANRILAILDELHDKGVC